MTITDALHINRYRNNGTIGHFLVCLVAIGLFQPLHTKAQVTSTTGERQDLSMIARLRDEGVDHSNAMQYAAELADDIGGRLTGSPEFDRAGSWAMQQLRSIGATDVHRESWGDFGMSWEQLRTTLLLEVPSPATLVAQATPSRYWQQSWRPWSARSFVPLDELV